jgi:MarR family transcriptional regulator, 2-MHQ and catechol-resistance regulon repressor
LCMATIGGASSGSITQAREFQDALLRLIPLVQFRDRELAATHGVSATQCLALRLWAEGGSLTVNDFAARLYVDKSTASRIAAGLEAKGYLSRSRDRDDARVAWLEATPAGHRLRVRIEEDLAARYVELLSDFDPEVRSVMTRLVSRLTASFAARVEASGGTCRIVR